MKATDASIQEVALSCWKIVERREEFDRDLRDLRHSAIAHLSHDKTLSAEQWHSLGRIYERWARECHQQAELLEPRISLAALS